MRYTNFQCCGFLLTFLPYGKQQMPAGEKIYFLTIKTYDMAVMKVIEILSESDKSWEDATRKGVEKASKSIKGIRSAWVQSQSVTLNENGGVAAYRVNLKLSFEVM